MSYQKSLKSLSPRNKLIVVYDLLHLFVFDPHIDKVDAKRLIKEIARSLRKLSKDRLVVVSFAHCDHEYEKSLLPVFDKRIKITNDVDNFRMLQLKVYSKRKKESSCASTQKGDINVDAGEMKSLEENAHDRIHDKEIMV